MLLTLKIIFLLVAVFYTLVNVGRLISGQTIPFLNLLFQAIGITGFVVFQWLI